MTAAAPAASATPAPSSAEPQGEGVADPRAIATHFLAVARHMSLPTEGLEIVRAGLPALAAGPGPSILFLRDGRALGAMTVLGVRRIVGAGGKSLRFEEATLVDHYCGVALAPAARQAAAAVLGCDDRPRLALAEASGVEAAPGDAAAAGSSRALIAGVFGRVLTARGGAVALLCLAAIVTNLIGFALPLYTMAIYDRVAPHGAMNTLAALTIGMGVVLAIDLAVRLAKARMVEAVALETGHELQEALFHRLTRARLERTPRSTGAISSALQAVDGLCMTAPLLLVALLIDAPFALLTLAYVGYIGGPIVLAPVAAIALLALATAAAHLGSKAASARAAKLTADRVAFLDQTVGMLESVKTATAAPMLARVWRRLVDASGFAGFVQRMAGVYAQQAAQTIGSAVSVAVLALGAGLIASGEMTVGALVACSMLVGRAVTPIAAALGYAMRLAQLAEGAGPAARLVAAPLETGGDASGARAGRIAGRIELRDVTFAYPGAARPALAGVSLAVEPGERVAIVGRIGCGKSSIARLATRLFEPSAGSVLVDGHDIRQFDPLRLRGDIAYLPQETDLFDDTLHENLTLGLADVAPEALEAAVAASGVKDIVAGLAEGYDFRIGPRGRRLSGGERQMVALARALMAPTPVLILDEPTAALDSQHEALVVRRLKPLLEGRTLILLTHRAPTLELVDRVVWLEAGRIVADGPRAEVVARIARGGASG